MSQFDAHPTLTYDAVGHNSYTIQPLSCEQRLDPNGEPTFITMDERYGITLSGLRRASTRVFAVDETTYVTAGGRTLPAGIDASGRAQYRYRLRFELDYLVTDTQHANALLAFLKAPPFRFAAFAGGPAYPVRCTSEISLAHDWPRSPEGHDFTFTLESTVLVDERHVQYLRRLFAFYTLADQGQEDPIPPLPGPTASFTAPAESLVVSFQNDSESATAAIAGPTYASDLTYHWEFGDGNASVETAPTHTYGAPGTYRVALTVSDIIGNTGTRSRWVTVGETSSTPVGGSTDPVARITVLGIATVGADTQVRFSGASSFNAVGYEWNFGDGTNGTGRDPVHVYDTAGPWTVALTARSASGATNTTSQVVSRPDYETGITNNSDCASRSVVTIGGQEQDIAVSNPMAGYDLFRPFQSSSHPPSNTAYFRVRNTYGYLAGTTTLAEVNPSAGVFDFSGLEGLLLQMLNSSDNAAQLPMMRFGFRIIPGDPGANTTPPHWPTVYRGDCAINQPQNAYLLDCNHPDFLPKYTALMQAIAAWLDTPLASLGNQKPSRWLAYFDWVIWGWSGEGSYYCSGRPQTGVLPTVQQTKLIIDAAVAALGQYMLVMGTWFWWDMPGMYPGQASISPPSEAHTSIPVGYEIFEYAFAAGVIGIRDDCFGRVDKAERLQILIDQRPAIAAAIRRGLHVQEACGTFRTWPYSDSAGNVNNGAPDSELYNGQPFGRSDFWPGINVIGHWFLWAKAAHVSLVHGLDATGESAMLAELNRQKVGLGPRLVVSVDRTEEAEQGQPMTVRVRVKNTGSGCFIADKHIPYTIGFTLDAVTGTTPVTGRIEPGEERAFSLTLTPANTGRLATIVEIAEPLGRLQLAQPGEIASTRRYSLGAMTVVNCP